MGLRDFTQEGKADCEMDKRHKSTGLVQGGKSALVEMWSALDCQNATGDGSLRFLLSRSFELMR